MVADVTADQKHYAHTHNCKEELPMSVAFAAKQKSIH